MGMLGDGSRPKDPEEECALWRRDKINTGISTLPHSGIFSKLYFFHTGLERSKLLFKK